MRKFTFLLSFALATLFFALSFSGVHAEPGIVVNNFQITSTSDQENAPHIYQNTVVYRRHSSPDVNIYGYNLLTQQEFPLVVKPGIKSPDGIYGNYMEYTDYTSPTSSDVHLLNVATGEDITIATGPTYNRGGAIWGDKVAYTAGNYNCGELYIYDITLQTNFDTSQNACWPLKMSEDVVVWSDYGNHGVFSYNVRTNTYEVLAGGDGYFHTTPNIFQNTIAWTKYDNFNNYYIYTKDIVTGQENLIKSSSNSILSWPAISNDYVVWVDNEGVGAHDVFAANRQSGEITQLTNEGSVQSSPTIPDIYGNTVVWNSWVTGNGDIYSATFDVAPFIDAINNTTLNEGSTYSTSGSFTDGDSTSWTATVDYGDGSGIQLLPLSGMNFVLSHVYEIPGTYTLTVSVTDNQGVTGMGSAQITVLSLPPIVGAIAVSPSSVQVNSSITASANFTDPDLFDTHTASWNWGDGNITSGSVTESNGSGSISDTHTYTSAGTYTITLTVADDSGSEGSTFQSISAYDPTPQGLFSGSRIFLDPSTGGRVMFGVNVKYQGTTPVGDVSMDFKKANFNFISTSIDSLVTSNGMATVRGGGTLNGASGYTFLVTGLDSSQTVRFQVKDSLNVIYDSQPGAPDTADPTTTVTGQIIVH